MIPLIGSPQTVYPHALEYELNLKALLNHLFFALEVLNIGNDHLR